MGKVVIGLGNIGIEIGARLHGRTDTAGLDLAPARREEWAARTGDEALHSLEDVDWERADRVFIIVRSSAAALALAEEVAARAKTALACHVMTTLDHDDALALGQHAADGLVRHLEQPVSGGAGGARTGELTVYSAGPLSAADEQFLRAHLAARVFPFAAYGQPTLAKLLNNTAAAYHLGVAAWALEQAGTHGIDPALMHEVLQTSSGASTIAGLAQQMGPDQGELLIKDVALLTEALGTPPAIGVLGGAPEAARAAIRRAVEGALSPRLKAPRAGAR